MKQEIDIMKAKEVVEHQLLSQFVLEIHSLVLPQMRMILITKIISIYKFFHRVKPPCGSYQTVYIKSGKISQVQLN
jgi:hypothetical protein